MKKTFGFWVLVVIAVLLNIMFILGQTLSLVNYDFTVSLGLQESVEEITTVGIAWVKGYAFGDTVFYIPLFIVGLIGLFKGKLWGSYSMFGALAVTVYWPICNLFTVLIGKDVFFLTDEKYLSYSILLPLIMIYGLWGMWFIYKSQKQNL